VTGFFWHEPRPQSKANDLEQTINHSTRDVASSPQQSWLDYKLGAAFGGVGDD